MWLVELPVALAVGEELSVEADKVTRSEGNEMLAEAAESERASVDEVKELVVDEEVFVAVDASLVDEEDTELLELLTVAVLDEDELSADEELSVDVDEVIVAEDNTVLLGTVELAVRLAVVDAVSVDEDDAVGAEENTESLELTRPLAVLAELDELSVEAEDVTVVEGDEELSVVTEDVTVVEDEEELVALLTVTVDSVVELPMPEVLDAVLKGGGTISPS